MKTVSPQRGYNANQLGAYVGGVDLDDPRGHGFAYDWCLYKTKLIGVTIRPGLEVLLPGKHGD